MVIELAARLATVERRQDATDVAMTGVADKLKEQHRLNDSVRIALSLPEGDEVAAALEFNRLTVLNNAILAEIRDYHKAFQHGFHQTVVRAFIAMLVVVAVSGLLYLDRNDALVIGTTGKEIPVIKI